MDVQRIAAFSHGTNGSNPAGVVLCEALPPAEQMLTIAATRAAAAALAGYLRDIGWPHGGLIDILQGEDMGMPSRLRAETTSEPAASIRVSGAARQM